MNDKWLAIACIRNSPAEQLVLPITWAKEATNLLHGRRLQEAGWLCLKQGTGARLFKGYIKRQQAMSRIAFTFGSKSF